jgi:hypothetical protein
MTNIMMKVRGIVSITLFLMLALALLTGFEGGESEGNEIGSDLHIASAAVLGLLSVVHIVLNQRMLMCQVKAILGIKNKPKNEC